MSEPVRRHYERYPYPHFPLFASVRACDTYAHNLTAIWTKFNSALPPDAARRILIAGCGSFSPYPFSVANPDSEITAIDLSAKSLRRARMHCLLHGRHNISYCASDLLDTVAVQGLFGLIDAYGVLHHLDDPLTGLRSLKERLAPGGILRVMVYNRYARREEESIRRAFRMLGISNTARAKDLIKRSVKGSRLRAFIDTSEETSFEAGLADALLHPCVRTYRIDGVLDLIRQAGLELLLFAHAGALECCKDEVDRIRRMEADRQSCGNFLFYLGHADKKNNSDEGEEFLVLNPCLNRAVSRFQFGTVHLPPRLGFENPQLGWRERSFLRKFIRPVTFNSLNSETAAEAAAYIRALFLLKYRN